MTQTPGALSRPAARVTLGRTSRRWLVLAANLALVGALVGVGLSASPLGVLAEDADYLADAAAIGVSLAAIRLSARPATPAQPNGYPGATRYAALVNAGRLLILSVLVAAGAVERLVTGTPEVHGLPALVRARRGGSRRTAGHRTPEVHGLPALVVRAVAAVVMLAGALLLGGDEDDDRADDERVGGDHDQYDHDALSVRAVLPDTARSHRSRRDRRRHRRRPVLARPRGRPRHRGRRGLPRNAPPDPDPHLASAVTVGHARRPRRRQAEPRGRTFTRCLTRLPPRVRRALGPAERHR
jgi:hypothetical protein